MVLSGFAVRGACAVALIKSKSAHRPGDIWTQQDNLPLLAINTLLAACCALNVLLLLRTRMLPPSKKGRPSCLPLAAAAIVAVAAMWGGVWLSLTAPSSMLLVEAGPDSVWLAPPLPPPSPPSRHNYGGYGMNSYGNGEYHHPPSIPPPPPLSPGEVQPVAVHLLTVVSGPCVVSGQCVHSAHYPRPYDDNERCTLRPVRGQPLRVEAFATEESEDYLVINGVRYSGRMANDWVGHAPPQSIIPDRDITWSSDGSVSRSGWRICQGPPPPPPPSPGAPPLPGEVQPKRYEPAAAWYFHNANALTGRGYSDPSASLRDWAILCFVGNGAGGLGLLLMRLLRGQQRRQRTAAAAAAALSTVVDAGAPTGAAGADRGGHCFWLLQLGFALLLELGGVRPPRLPLST